MKSSQEGSTSGTGWVELQVLMGIVLLQRRFVLLHHLVRQPGLEWQSLTRLVQSVCGGSKAQPALCITTHALSCCRECKRGVVAALFEGLRVD